MNFPQSFKVIACGAGGVGKTSFLDRYLANAFNPTQYMTIGINYAARHVEFDEGRVELQIWDFGGQVELRPFLYTYFEGVLGILLMFDLTRYSTFLDLDNWMNALNARVARRIPILLVGCKDDLCERDPGEQAVPGDQIQEYVQEYHLVDFVRTSAASGKNVQYCIDRMVGAIRNSVARGGRSGE